LYWGYCVTFTKFLTIIIVEFTPSIILLYSPLSIPGIVSTGFIFPFSYMSTYFTRFTILLYLKLKCNWACCVSFPGKSSLVIVLQAMMPLANFSRVATLYILCLGEKKL
jgi:hypothetical protein